MTSVELDDEPDPKCAPAVELEELVLVADDALGSAEQSFSLVSDEHFSNALHEQSIAEDHVQLADDAHEHSWEGLWEPGVNVGRWLRRGIAPIEEQTQDVVTNVVASFSKLPKHALNSIISALPPLEGVSDDSTGRLCYKAAARTLRGLSILLMSLFVFLRFGETGGFMKLTLFRIWGPGCVSTQVWVLPHYGT